MGTISRLLAVSGARAGYPATPIHSRDDKRLLRLQRQLAGYKLLIIDELGYYQRHADRQGHRWGIGLPDQLRRSLGCTNAIESLIAVLRKVPLRMTI